MDTGDLNHCPGSLHDFCNHGVVSQTLQRADSQLWSDRSGRETPHLTTELHVLSEGARVQCKVTWKDTGKLSQSIPGVGRGVKEEERGGQLPAKLYPSLVSIGRKGRSRSFCLHGKPHGGLGVGTHPQMTGLITYPFSNGWVL